MELNKAITILYGVAVFAIALMVGVAIDRINDRAKENRAAVQFICETTTVLDDLVVAGADSISLNFENGTYERLLEQGILTQDNVDAARNLMERYRNSHTTLTKNTEACDAIG